MMATTMKIVNSAGTAISTYTFTPVPESVDYTADRNILDFDIPTQKDYLLMDWASLGREITISGNLVFDGGSYTLAQRKQDLMLLEEALDGSGVTTTSGASGAWGVTSIGSGIGHRFQSDSTWDEYGIVKNVRISQARGEVSVLRYTIRMAITSIDGLM
jgi:hypothetical protein